MEPRNSKVKIPCNHRLEYVEMAGISDAMDWTWLGRPDECNGCGETFAAGYFCSSCKFGAHIRCIDFPDMINHPSHSMHTSSEDRSDERNWVYRCLDLECSRYPPPLTIYNERSHNHAFTLMPIIVYFACNACGVIGDRNPYVCLECGFMLHKDCIDLPRVIEINRHDHRVSRTYQLGHGDWVCGVCREKMNWSYGAFSCKLCLVSYGVHSKCATRDDVWDGNELEDVPEEEEEDPYKVISEKEIIHFSHQQHNLRLIGGDDDDDIVAGNENMRCNACILPIDSDPFFRCLQCDFCLDKVCASFPRKKRNILHKHKLALVVGYEAHHTYTRCTYCGLFFDGFRYNCHSDDNCTSGRLSSDDPFSIDMRCASISEPFHHELHPYPLYRTSAETKTCVACGGFSPYVLNCIVVEFALCMECATLPRKVKHRCDDHILSLHHGRGNSDGQLWCDICERKTDPSVWFYGCDDCGVTLHKECVLGDTYKCKPGNTYFKGELVPNNGMTRPICFVCERRCMFPFFLKGVAASSGLTIYACSIYYCAVLFSFNKWYNAVNATSNLKEKEPTRGEETHQNPPSGYIS